MNGFTGIGKINVFCNEKSKISGFSCLVYFFGNNHV